MKIRRRRVNSHRRRSGKPVPVAWPRDGVAERIRKEAEAIREDEDDFADGRSSAGRTLRDEEDAWGRGIAPESRPFPEEDVPPRPEEPPPAGPKEKDEEPEDLEGAVPPPPTI